MGIHFACHHCNHAMHVKEFQAGKRGRCPACNQSFRIPIKDADYSSSIEDPSYQPSGAKVQTALKKATLEALSMPNALASDSSSSIALDTEPVVTARTASKSANLERSVPSSDGNSKPGKKVQNATPPETPKSLFDSPDAKWFVRPPSGGQFGPAPSQLLMDWVRERRVTSDSLLWCEGMAHWQLATELLPDLFSQPKESMQPVSLGGDSGKLFTIESATSTSAPSAAPALQQSAALTAIALKKKSQKRRQQLNVVILLGIVSAILLCVLVYVLFFQVTKASA